MDIPAKIRLLNRVRRVFPKWAIERQALVIEHAFDSELLQASKAKGGKAQHFDPEELPAEILEERNREASQYWHQLDELRSRKLVSRAKKLHISRDGLKWDTDQYGNRYLDSTSEAQLHGVIREESRKVWEFRIKVIGALTGLIGTLIGLVSVWRK